MVSDRDPVGTDETAEAIVCVDTHVRIMLGLLRGDRVSKASLECHQFRPVQAHISLHAIGMHAADGIDYLFTADEHLLRIASAQRAGSAERSMIDHGDSPAPFADTGDYDLRGGA